jgi:hypothetical protein
LQSAADAYGWGLRCNRDGFQRGIDEEPLATRQAASNGKE